MSEDGQDLDQLRAQTEQGDRLDEDPGDDVEAELVDAIANQLDAVDAGDVNKTVSVWDGQLAALFAALDERPDDRQRVGEALASALGADSTPDEVERAQLIKLALRAGLRAAPDDVLAAAERARDQHEQQDVLDGL